MRNRRVRQNTTIVTAAAGVRQEPGSTSAASTRQRSPREPVESTATAATHARTRLHLIDAEVRDLVAAALADTEASLQEVGAEALGRLAQSLIERETMGGSEFAALAEAELGELALFRAVLPEAPILAGGAHG